MALSSGIALLVIGAILSFAVKDSIEAVNLVVVGYIAMAAGALSIILSMVLKAQGEKVTRKEIIERHDDSAPEAIVP